MATFDLMKDLKHLYVPSAKEPTLVDVPEIGFLMVDGSGDPNETTGFGEAMGAFYPVAYTLKFMLKKGELPPVDGFDDFKVMPPEGLWWTRGKELLDPDDREAWMWTALMAMPPFVDEGLVDVAKDAVAAKAAKKKEDPPPALGRLRLERFTEGPSAQVMHIGPYSKERPTIERLHAFIQESGHRPRGKHHEIYVGDPGRSDSAKLKTVVRQPVGRTDSMIIP